MSKTLMISLVCNVVSVGAVAIMGCAACKALEQSKQSRINFRNREILDCMYADNIRAVLSQADDYGFGFECRDSLETIADSLEGR